MGNLAFQQRLQKLAELAEAITHELGKLADEKGAQWGVSEGGSKEESRLEKDLQDLERIEVLAETLTGLIEN